MKFSKNIKRAISFMLAFGLSYGAVAPSITPAAASELSYSVMIEPKYQDASYFSEGLAAVKQNDKWGYIDETGKTIIPFEYDYAFPFSEGVAVVAKYGTSHLPSEYQNNPDVYEDNYYWYVIDKNNNAKLLTYDYNYEINGTSEQVILPIYTYSLDDIYSDALCHNGYINMLNIAFNDYGSGMIFDRNGNYANINKDPNADSYHMQCAYTFNEGVFAAFGSASSETGFLDENGNLFLSYDSYDVRPFNQGLAPIKDWDGKWGFINKSGNMVIPHNYYDFYVRGLNTTYQVFNDGIASVKNTNYVWGGIDKTGKTVIPFEYEVLRAFNEGLAVAQKNGKFGVIDTNNNVVVPFEYDELSGYGSGRCVAIKNGRAFCIDRYGNEITGSDKISQNSYFKGDESVYTIQVTPSDTIIIEENNLYGFASTKFTPDLPKESEMDSWAYEEVSQAIKNDLVPVYLQNQYKINIDRGDFAALVVTLLEQASGKDIDTLVKEETGKTINELLTAYPFTDTTSSDVIAANALGIINGRGNGTFDPYASITRQEAAALLMRIGKYMGKTDIDTSSTNFADKGSIQSYAVEAVNYVNALNVMKGTSDTTFSPNGTYTRQQAYITALRLYNAIK